MVTPSLVALTLFFAAPVDAAPMDATPMDAPPMDATPFDAPAPVVPVATSVAVRPKTGPTSPVFAPTAKGVCLKLASCTCAPKRSLKACAVHLESEAAQRRATMPRGLEALLEGMGTDAPQGPHALSWDQTVRSSCDQACAAWGAPLKRRPGAPSWTPTSRRADASPRTPPTTSGPEGTASTSSTARR